MSNPKPTPIATRSYTITVYEYEDGHIELERKNSGFAPIELLGAIKIAYDELLDYLHRQTRPTQINKTITSSKTTLN